MSNEQDPPTSPPIPLVATPYHLGGRLRIAGTRLWVEHLTSHLAEGGTVDTYCEHYGPCESDPRREEWLNTVRAAIRLLGAAAYWEPVVQAMRQAAENTKDGMLEPTLDETGERDEWGMLLDDRARWE